MMVGSLPVPIFGRSSTKDESTDDWYQNCRRQSAQADLVDRSVAASHEIRSEAKAAFISAGRLTTRLNLPLCQDFAPNLIRAVAGLVQRGLFHNIALIERKGVYTVKGPWATSPCLVQVRSIRYARPNNYVCEPFRPAPPRLQHCDDGELAELLGQFEPRSAGLSRGGGTQVQSAQLWHIPNSPAADSCGVKGWPQ